MKRRELNRDFILSRVEMDPMTACWNWTGSLNVDGRAVYNTVYAYRISYEVFVEALLGRQVNHHCDNPACVNPDHLYAGTQQENIADAVARGRLCFPVAPRGEAQHCAYPDAVVDVVRARYVAGEMQKDLAREYGVSLSQVRRWVSGGDRERRPIKRAKASCGSRSGYGRHLREATPVCAPCAEANRTYMAEYKARRELSAA